MTTAALTYEQQVIRAPRPGGLAYTLFFFMGSLAINTFYLVFEQEERRFILWGLLGLGFAASFALPRSGRIWVHRIIDVCSFLTLAWFIYVLTDNDDNLSRFGNYLGQLVCIFLVLFSFRTFRQNDFAWIMVISLVIMLLCSIPIYAASYIYSILAFLFFLTSGLLALNVYPGDPDDRPEEEPIMGMEWARQFGGTFALSLAIFVLCAGIFAGLPQRRTSKERETVRRIFGVESLGAETNSGGDADAPEDADDVSSGATYSGFSEQFEIAQGRGGAIQEDVTPILNLRAPGPQYLKAIAWDQYTGHSWIRTEGAARFRPLVVTNEKDPTLQGLAQNPDPDEPEPPARHTLKAFEQQTDRIASKATQPRWPEAEISLVGHTRSGAGYLFVPWQSVQVDGEFHKLEVDDMGSMRIAPSEIGADDNRDLFQLTKGDSWVARFRAVSPERPDAAIEPLSAENIARYTQLPATTPERIRALGRQVAGDQGDVAVRAHRVMSYLRGQKNYSLTPPILAEGADAVDTWLFESQEGGHCEYFSTSMAVLLRAAGIPTRVVTGFSHGTFNVGKGVWVIRGKDAHAWVEVFVPGHGWVAFDPTPASMTEDFGDAVSGVTARFSRALEQYFIYDPRGFWQYDFPRFIASTHASLLTSGRQLTLWGTPTILGIPRGLLAILAIGGLWFGISSTVAFRRYGVPWGDFAALNAAKISDWSLGQLAVLQRRLTKADPDLPTGLTIEELAERVEGQKPRLADALRELSWPFHVFHYGPPGGRPEWRERVLRAWRGVRGK